MKSFGTFRVLALTLAVLGTSALAGCGIFETEPPVRIDTTRQRVAERWNATLNTPRQVQGVVDITGDAWMHPEGDNNTTQVEVAISNATPGGVHPWEVRRGRCGDDAGTLGSRDSYEPLEVGDEGSASQSTTLAVNPSVRGDYHVVVFASSTNRDLTIACGNLAPPTD